MRLHELDGPLKERLLKLKPFRIFLIWTFITFFGALIGVRIGVSFFQLHPVEYSIALSFSFALSQTIGLFLLARKVHILNANHYIFIILWFVLTVIGIYFYCYVYFGTLISEDTFIPLFVIAVFLSPIIFAMGAIQWFVLIFLFRKLFPSIKGGAIWVFGMVFVAIFCSIIGVILVELMYGKGFYYNYWLHHSIVLTTSFGIAGVQGFVLAYCFKRIQTYLYNHM